MRLAPLPLLLFLLFTGSSRICADSGVERLVPRIRELPLSTTPEGLSGEALGALLPAARLLPPDVLDDAPRVAWLSEGRVLGGVGERLKASGAVAGEGRWVVVRPRGMLRDGASGAALGVEGEIVGWAVGEPADEERRTARVTQALREVRVGDRVLAESALDAPPEAASPPGPVTGRIAGVAGGLPGAGVFGVVILALGTRNGLAEGRILEVCRREDAPDDGLGRLAFWRKAPAECAEPLGRLMVARPGARLSYAVVLEARRPLRTGDGVRGP